MGWWGDDGGYYDDIFERNAANTRYRQNEERNRLLKQQNELLMNAELDRSNEQLRAKQAEIEKALLPKRKELIDMQIQCREEIQDAGLNHNYVRKVYSYYEKNRESRDEKTDIIYEDSKKKKLYINNSAGQALFVLCWLIGAVLIFMTFGTGARGTLTNGLYIMTAGFIIKAISSISMKKKIVYNAEVDKQRDKAINENKLQYDQKLDEIVNMYHTEREKIYNSDIEHLLRRYEKNLRRKAIYKDYEATIVNGNYIFNNEAIIKNIYLGDAEDYNKMLKSILNKINDLEGR